MPVPTQTRRVAPQTTTYSSSYSSNSTVGSPPASLSSYNNTMHSYTRAQIQEFRNAAFKTMNAPELGERRNIASTTGTSSSCGSVGSNQGHEASIASHDFAQVGKRAW
ncbi:hypothetical protein V501_01269 [Pseudogymnoascus sp. VKM F-4519 (FW-2642)]|nr:hypothetical protein V501_01269 [Pseudogymnoascus sp. VKM F-4519 (FW-2642)]